MAKKNKRNKSQNGDLSKTGDITPEYEEWRQKVKDGETFSKRKKAKELQSYRNAYEGRDTEINQDNVTRGEIRNNMVYLVVSTLAPSIGFSRPKMFVQGTKSTFNVKGKEIPSAQGAARLQALLNFMFKKLDLETEFKKSVTESLIGHEGVFYTGFDMQTFEEFDDEGERFDIIESENLVCKRVDPAFILKDAMSTDPDAKDARWLGIRWERMLDEVKADSTLSNTDNLQPNGIMEFDKNLQESVFVASSRPPSESRQKWKDMVRGYDIYDKKNGKFFVIVPEHDKFLRDKKEWPLKYKHGNGYPVDFLWYNFNPNKSYAMADTGMYLRKQEGIDFLERRQLEFAQKQSMVKLVINSKKKFSKEQIKTWLEDDPFAVLPVDGNANNAVAVVGGGPGGSDIAVTKENFKTEILQMLGVDPRLTGYAPKLGSKEGAQRVSLTTPAKHEERERCVEKFMTSVMGKLAGVAQQVSNETEIPLDDGSFADIVKTSPDILSTQDQQGGPEVEAGQQAPQTQLPFIKIDEELLAGEFMFKVQVGSTQGTDERLQEERLQNLVNVTKENPAIDQNELAKLILERMGLSEFMIRLFKPPEQVQQEQQQAFEQQLELAMAEPRLKTDTDLEKTKLKTESAENVAEINTMGKEFDSKRKDERKKDEIDNETLKILSGDESERRKERREEKSD